MTHLFGFTRNVVTDRYALLTPAGFVTAPLPGWRDAACVVLISPAMGAKFSQILVTLTQHGHGAGRTGGDELFAIVLNGACRAVIGRHRHQLVDGGYVFVPPGTRFEFSRPEKGTRLLLFQKRFLPLTGTPRPPVVAGQSGKRPGTPFLGDPDARLQTLLPDTAAFDLAVNIFTFEPGATLPFVETHVMEHGLLMLAGQGIYRLDSAWHPVQAGDAIWMAPYCPQWFIAMGKTRASYIYYKDVNRPAQPSSPS
jgi:(S)-ureidoglycine aminohydrolase